jgi:hypothetical protein
VLGTYWAGGPRLDGHNGSTGISLCHHRLVGRTASSSKGRIAVVTVEDVRAIALSLPRAYEALVRDHVKFRIGRLVFLSISPDETRLGFGYPKEEREALVATEPEKFLLPVPSDMRYNWVRVRLDAIDRDELEQLIVNSWRMCVPKKVWAEYDSRLSDQA